MSSLRFQQIDVFAHQALMGNPLALVHEAQALSEQDMAKLARWTNLSETAFLLPPTHAQADYRVRIWTPRTELPFAGHPTLGSCHGWLTQSITPKNKDFIIQECAIGLIKIRRAGENLAFAAPALRKSAPIEPDTLAAICNALALSTQQVLDHQVVDNGPEWMILLLDRAESVLSIKRNVAALAPYKIGVIGPYINKEGDADFEVRAFSADASTGEDPVTGSLNAGIASWMIKAGLAPKRYVVSQGTALDRAGRLYIEETDDQIWIAGRSTITIEGTIEL